MMKEALRHKRPSPKLLLWPVAMVLLLCYFSCSKDKAEQEERPTVLTIYVYSPEKPVVTRADIDDVDATAAENAIHNLQIWVFVHESGELVGYLQPTVDVLNRANNYAYLMEVSDAFARNHPNVDVYVMANPWGNSLGPTSSQAELEESLLLNAESADFGVGHITTAVPYTGLPMTGVLRNQPVTGENPVLRIGTTTEMATVQLKRVVSKICFYFTCQSAATEQVEINSITLNGNMIPTDEYLFLYGDGRDYHVGSTYETSAAQLASDIGAPAQSEDPDTYCMEFDEETGLYTASVLQKQGYYNYQYIIADENGRVSPLPSEGNFYQTENRYQALVYYKGTGGRTWRLVGYTQVTLQ